MFKKFVDLLKTYLPIYNIIPNYVYLYTYVYGVYILLFV